MVGCDACWLRLDINSCVCRAQDSCFFSSSFWQFQFRFSPCPGERKQLMNFNEVLIKDSQLTRRWGNGKVFKGNVSGGHALFVPHFANQVLSGINQQVHQYFYFVCAIMTSVTRSLQTVLWEMSALLSLMILSAAGGQYCCWCAWLNALKWFLPLTRTG